jgi:hypothetical protein
MIKMATRMMNESVKKSSFKHNTIVANPAMLRTSKWRSGAAARSGLEAATIAGGAERIRRSAATTVL